MPTSKLQVAVIGTGRAGLIHARNFRSGVPGAQLAAIVEIEATRRQQLMHELELERGWESWQDAVADQCIDAVVVATPTHLHHDIVLAAAAMGKHVLCEKPLAVNATEAGAMLDAVARSGIRLQVGFMRRYDASFAAAKARVEEGEIGAVVLVKSLTRGPSQPQPWMLDITRSNGPLAEVCSHDIDALRWFSGSEFATVYALGGNHRCPEASKEYPAFYYNVIPPPRFANGTQGSVEGAMGVRYG